MPPVGTLKSPPRSVTYATQVYVYIREIRVKHGIHRAATLSKMTHKCASMLCSKPIRRIPGFAYSTPERQCTSKSSQNTSNLTPLNTPKCTQNHPKFPIITPKMTLFDQNVSHDTLLRTPQNDPFHTPKGPKWGGQHIGGRVTEVAILVIPCRSGQTCQKVPAGSVLLDPKSRFCHF